MKEGDSERRNFLKGAFGTTLKKPIKPVVAMAGISSVIRDIFPPGGRFGRREFLQRAGLGIGATTIGGVLIKTIWDAAYGDQQTEAIRNERVENIVLYNQTDNSWKIDDTWNEDSTCGPTTIAMVLSSFEDVVTPDTIDRIFQTRGFRPGMAEATMFRNVPGNPDVLSWLKERKYETTRIFDKAAFIKDAPRTFDFEMAQKMLEEGHLLIASGVVNWISKFPEGADHIFGIKAVNPENQTITVFDPWDGQETVRALSQMSQFHYAYAVRPTAEMVPGYYDVPEIKRMSVQKTPIRDKELVNIARGIMNLSPEGNYVGKVPPSFYSRGTRTGEELVMLNNFLRPNNPMPGDIITALEMSVTVDGRATGMDMLWRKRQAGELREFGIYPLDKTRTKWALDNGIDPRILAIAKDVAPMVKKILRVGKDIFFDGTSQEDSDKIDFDDVLPNPGLISKLMQQETGITETDDNPLFRYWGLVNMGQGLAYNEVNLSQSLFPSAHEDLEWITKRLEDSTGLPYYQNRSMTPGSIAGNEDASGGAIGPQIVPIYTRLIMDKYDQVLKKLDPAVRARFPEVLNPFNPFSAMIMAYLFLSSEFIRVHGSVNKKLELVKPGYRVSGIPERYKKEKTRQGITNLDQIAREYKIDVLLYWNPDLSQATNALNAGFDYFNHFGRK